MTLVRFGASGVLLGIWPAILAAQAPAVGVVTGRVTARTDSTRAAPAVGAAISVVGSTLAATTGDDGRFLIDGVPVGNATLRIRLVGYRIRDQRIRVVGGDTVRVDVLLQSDAQLLSAVRTTARNADLELFLTRPGVATVTLGAAAIAGVPSIGEPDVVRTVQLLPGVIARNDYNTGLDVRGGEADQNLILLDGHPIYNPFHFGGLFSTFMDATVGGIELLTGAFPARFGGRLSSVLDVRSAEELRPGVHGSADVSMLATTGRLAGAFGGGKGSWSVAARRTYADALQSIFTNNIFPYHFSDVHAHVAYVLPGNVRLAVTAYTGRDVLDANLAEFSSDSVPTNASSGHWAFDWGNQVLGATLSKELGPDTRVAGRRLGDSTTIEQRISTSGFSTRLDLGDGAFAQRSEIRDLRLSGSLLVRDITDDRSIGYEVATHRIRYSSGSPQTGTSDFDLVQRPTSAALWVNDLWRISPRWLVEGGLRAEGLTGRQWAALSPRVSVKYFATPELALTAAAGRMTQWQQSLAGDGPLRYFDIWIASDSFIPVEVAWHWIAGVERRLSDVGTIRVEGYAKRYDRVLVANSSEDPQIRGDEFFAARGLSYGADLLARWQPAAGLSGWISYSYGVSSRWRDTLEWAPGHDRRHDLNVVATWRMAKYRVGARFGYATGTPYTPIVGGVARRMYDPSLDRWGTGEPIIDIESIGGAYNSERFPPSHRLDLDVSREFQRGGATLTPYLNVVNAYNAKNVFVYLYKYSTDQPTRRAISQFPVLPSMGVRIAF